VIKFISRLNLSGTKVDRDAGIIRDVSLISLGEARGHGKTCDQKTLETVRDCAKTYSDGLRIRWNPSTFQHGAGMLLGWIPPNTIKVKGDKTVGDLHVYKAFPSEPKEYLYEIAETTPGNIGLSVEFTGDDEEIDGNKFARCTEIYAAMLVDLPAANPTGLFAENLTTHQESLNPATENKPMKPEDIKTLVESNEFKTAFKTLLTECMPKPPEKTQEQKDREEMAAAGVTDKDDDKAKQEKLSAFRTGAKKVSDMTANEFSGVIARANMQFFRSTGGKPTKASEGDGGGNGSVNKFETRVQTIMDNGCERRSEAIQRARQDAPADYNEWMAKQHPTTQKMERK
jgi:hypothetical protein